MECTAEHKGIFAMHKGIALRNAKIFRPPSAEPKNPITKTQVTKSQITKKIDD